MTNVLIWNEYVGQEKGAVHDCYPETMHGCIAKFLNDDTSISAKTAILEQDEHGLSEDVLTQTDVLIWWGHCAHHLVDDAVAKRVIEHVHKGMGIIFLHSAHMSKPFLGLMGTTGSLSWMEREGISEKLHCLDRTHPITVGVDPIIELPREEVYAEPFDIPTPDDLLYIGWFSNGYVFRSGACYKRGLGKVFYFQPGHETFPIYRDPQIQKIVTNAVKWARPITRVEKIECPQLHD